ncbi:MAG TPA: WecB/TagA/CpsF family glycosyltransferase [Kofleriaceae bacterium]|nr:WecB/TagA/CpsF family glycosyltransferase [Kofleriaceae bacterium]
MSVSVQAATSVPEFRSELEQLVLDQPAVTAIERTIEPMHVARVPIHPVDMQAALARVDEFISTRTPHYNIAINAAKIVEFQDDEALRNAIDEAHLLTADGQAVVWASRLLGQPVPARVAGTDLMQALLAHAGQRDYSVYLLGAKDEIVRACVAKAQKEHPSLRIAGYRNGYFRRDEEDELVAAIRAANPDILFLGFGTPAKEYFMHRHYRALGVPFVMGVGGSFDVYAGLVARAPRWMQRAGLEWAFRLAQEPRRMWKRYLVGNTRFAWIIARELFTRRARP